jgi:dTDP-4-amino-4,6-dideoxygalactose transaminase
MLAIKGGKPIRTKLFSSSPFTDQNEIESVKELLKEGILSKFLGSPHKEVERMLISSSETLVKEYKDLEKSFLGGNYVRKFEYEWSKLINSTYCISVNSATSGLATALLAIKNNKGSMNIITTPFSFTATVGSILIANCTPIFCDIDLDTFTISPESLEYILKESNTIKQFDVLLPVHWCGNAGNFDKILDIAKQHSLYVVEDSAQAPLTKYKDKFLGTHGIIGVFSFNEPKNIQTGEGGMIVTDSIDLAEKCRLIRNHGENIPDSNFVGYNFRLTEIQAAIGIEQLKKANYLNDIRRTNWNYLKQKIVENFGEFIIPQKITNEDTFNAYTASFRFIEEIIGVNRDKFAEALIAEGIPVSTGIPTLLCDHKATKKFPNNVPNARKLNKQYLGFFQIGWSNTISDMDDIIKGIKKIIDNKGELK